MTTVIPTIAPGPSPAALSLAQGCLSSLTAGLGAFDRESIGEERLTQFTGEMNGTLNAVDGQLASLGGGVGPVWLFRLKSDPEVLRRLVHYPSAAINHDFTVQNLMDPKKDCPSLIIAHSINNTEGAARSDTHSRLFLSVAHLSHVPFPEWVYFEVRRDAASVNAGLAVLMGSLSLFETSTSRAPTKKIKKIPTE